MTAFTTQGAAQGTQDTAELTIEIELGAIDPHLDEELDEELAAGIRAAVDQRVGQLANGLGLPLRPRSRIAIVPGVEPLLRVRIAGQCCRFPDGLPAVVAAALRGGWPQPDALRSTSADLIDVGYPELAELIALVCYEAVRLRPSVLVTPAAVEQYRADLVAASPEGDEGVDSHPWLDELLCRIVDLGISVADRASVARILAEQEATDALRAAEAVIGELASDTIGVLTPAELWPQLGTGDLGDEDDLLAFVQRGMTEETGIVLPRPVLEPADGLPTGTFAIRINDVVSLPIPLVPPGMILVNGTPNLLPAGMVHARPVLNSASSSAAALVSAENNVALQAAGWTTWLPAGHVVLHVATAARRQLGALVSQDRLLAQLDVMEQSSPEVVRAARGQLPPAQLTDLLRRLAIDRVPLRELSTVLERVVDLPMIAHDRMRFTLTTDPVYAVPDDGVSPTLAFVRTGLRHQLAQQFATSPGTIVGYLLAPEIEAVVGDPGHSEGDLDRVLAAVRAVLATLPPNGRVPVVLTTPDTREPLQRVLRTTYPDLTALSYDDLPPYVSVQAIDRIAWADEEIG